MENAILTLSFFLTMSGFYAAWAAEPSTQPSTSGNTPVELLRPLEALTQPVPSAAGYHDYDAEDVQATQEWLHPYFDATDSGHKTKTAMIDKIVATLPEKLSVPAKQKRRILVITSNMDIHPFGAVGLLILLRTAEKKYGAFELTDAYTLKGIDAAMLSRFDAVVLNNITKSWHEQDSILVNRVPALRDFREKVSPFQPPAEEKLLMENFRGKLLPEYVKNGGGLFSIHGSILQFNGEWIGGSPSNPWIASVHPRGTQWRWPHPFNVKIVEPSNPLAKAFNETPDVKLGDELYIFDPKRYPDHGRPIISVDTNTIIPKDSYPPSCDDYTASLIWIKDCGKGRIYYSTLGHGWEIFAVPTFSRALLDGIQYVTGDLQVPPPPTEATTKP